jgi:hypothetical protein
MGRKRRRRRRKMGNDLLKAHSSSSPFGVLTKKPKPIL